MVVQKSLRDGKPKPAGDDSQQRFLAQHSNCNIVATLFQIATTFSQHCNAVLR